MDRESMTHEENYFFDNEGYIIIPGVLTRKELDTLNSTLDEAGRTDSIQIDLNLTFHTVCCPKAAPQTQVLQRTHRPISDLSILRRQDRKFRMKSQGQRHRQIAPYTPSQVV